MAGLVGPLNANLRLVEAAFPEQMQVKIRKQGWIGIGIMTFRHAAPAIRHPKPVSRLLAHGGYRRLEEAFGMHGSHGNRLGALIARQQVGLHRLRQKSSHEGRPLAICGHGVRTQHAEGVPVLCPNESFDVLGWSHSVLQALF